MSPLASDKLVCRVGATLCALPIEHVEEVFRPLPIESLAGVPPFVHGLAVIRGIPTPVVNARRLLSNDAGDACTRWVTLKVGHRKVALAVDSVIGLRNLDVVAFDQLPPLLREAGSEIVSAIGTLDSDLLLVLGSAKILAEGVWETLESEKAQQP